MEQGRGGRLLPGPLERSQLIGSQTETEQRDAGQGRAVGRQPWTSFQGKTSVTESSGPGRKGLKLTKPNFP